MKTLTIHQPFAMLLATGDKEYETRSWKTDYRGELAIHAGKNEESLFYYERDEIREIAVKYGYYGHSASYRRGFQVGTILAVAQLIAVKPTCPTVTEIGDFEQCYGDWRCGRYAWQMKIIYRFCQPVEARGNQGLWNWRPQAGVEALIRQDYQQLVWNGEHADPYFAVNADYIRGLDREAERRAGRPVI